MQLKLKGTIKFKTNFISIEYFKRILKGVFLDDSQITFIAEINMRLIDVIVYLNYDELKLGLTTGSY